MSDLISRADAIEYIDRVCNSGLGKKKSLDYIHKYISALPSAELPLAELKQEFGLADAVQGGDAEMREQDFRPRYMQQTPSEDGSDLISREDAKNIIRKDWVKTMPIDLDPFIALAMDDIDALPSAEITGALDDAIAKYVADGYMLPPSGDLISRAEAIKQVHSVFCIAIEETPTEEDEDGLILYTDMKTVNNLLRMNKAISTRIKALPSVSAERSGEWIPCSERLPSDDECVIVSVLDDNGDTPWKYTTVAWLCNGVWISDNDILCGTAVAWMPLPKPYKGGDSE